MITILHTADWHLGQTFFGHGREKEHQHFLKWLIDTTIEHQADVLLVSGDVFDVSNPSAYAQRMFYSFIQEITTHMPSLQIVITAGNHDSPSRIETPIPLLADKRVHIVGTVVKREGEIIYDELIVPLKNKLGEIEAYCLAVPYLRQGDYPRVEATNPYAGGVTELYKRLKERVEQQKNDQQGVVAMGHLQAIGCDIADTDYSEKMIIGGLESIPSSIFLDFNYTALGHIHKAQKLAKSEAIRYSGSPLPMSFAETNYIHGVVKVVLEQGETTSIEKLTYSPLVSLISVPKQGAAKPADLLEELQQLPDKKDGDSFESYPYLEIKVLLTEPQPLLPRQISDILENKAVRFTRIVNEFRTEGERGEDIVIQGGLEDLKPMDIANRYYYAMFKEEMPEQMQTLFNEVCMKLNRGE